MHQYLLLLTLPLILVGCTLNSDIADQPKQDTNLIISEKDGVISVNDDMQEIPETNKNPEITFNLDGSIDTSKWAPYKNEEYNYEVLIPDFLELDPSTDLKDQVKHPDSFVLFTSKSGSCPVSDGESLLCSISILAQGPDYGGSFDNGYEEIKIGANDEILANINNIKSEFDEGLTHYDHYERSCEGFNVYIEDRAPHWNNGRISFSTKPFCNQIANDSPETKLLIDTILGSFDY